MTNGYLTFLDYLELRRRVEKRLNSGNWFLLHIILFAIMTALIGSAAYSPYSYEFRDYFIRPVYGHFVALMSGALLLHGLWSLWHSGWRAGQREQVIEREMRERLETDDMYLSDHPKDLFRLHGLLNDDTQKRAGSIPILLFFVFLNALVWIPWALQGQANGSFAWETAPMLIPPLLLALLWSFWRRSRQETRLRKQVEEYFGYAYKSDVRDYERETRLSSDDEMVTVDEYMLKRKRE